MPTIDVSDATFFRLQQHAQPLIDTSETVITKLLDFIEEESQCAPTNIGAKDYGISAPNLTHTKVLYIDVGQKTLAKSDTNWNGLLNEIIIQAALKVKDVNVLKKLVVIPCVVGEKNEAGYRHLEKAGVSVQGQDANAAWKAAAHIAKALKIPLEVFFMWYDNEKAAHPGQTGKLAYTS